MNVSYTLSDDEPNRKELIENILPKQTIIASILEPSIENRLFSVLAKCVKEELEIYRKYPKRTLKEIEEAKAQVKDFDPRHPKTCFMGKAFKSNYHITDAELNMYRRAVGTIPHPIWGKCTLLEIWGGDHIADYKEMVIGAFKYGAGINKNCPTIHVHVNPLFQNSKSGTFTVTEEEKEEQEYKELLMAKALFYGVKEPKRKKR
ncbi:hypothetical protein F132_24 [Flavobacterium sp. phage 1/32]|nr:hypothetical protein F132_24 [Flavobacterium sp. phage 1/32]